MLIPLELNITFLSKVHVPFLAEISLEGAAKPCVQQTVT